MDVRPIDVIWCQSVEISVNEKTHKQQRLLHRRHQGVKDVGKGPHGHSMFSYKLQIRPVGFGALVTCLAFLLAV